MSKRFRTPEKGDKIEQTTDGDFLFWCPGCKSYHFFRCATDSQKSEPVWKWNFSFKKPTVTPSIRVRTHDGDKELICHFFVRDGRIEYLNDCWHDKRGKTIPMTDVDL